MYRKRWCKILDCLANSARQQRQAATTQNASFLLSSCSQAIAFLCAHAQQGQACPYICITLFVYSICDPKVTAVSYLSAQKKLHQIWSAGVSLDLHTAQLVRYSWWVADQALFLGIRTHTVSPRGFMGSIYAHSYGQTILVRCTVHVLVIAMIPVRKAWNSYGVLHLPFQF